MASKMKDRKVCGQFGDEHMMHACRRWSLSMFLQFFFVVVFFYLFFFQIGIILIFPKWSFQLLVARSFKERLNHYGMDLLYCCRA